MMMSAMPPFALYPEAQHWWSLNDYAAVLGVTTQLQAKTVLEFGPGSSTLSLIEGGAERIDCCEDDPAWQRTYEERLAAKFPGVVTIHAYRWSAALSIPAIDDRRYDLALIDGPHQTQRAAAIEYCLQRCAAVLFPTEDHGHVNRSGLRSVAVRLAEKYSRTLEFAETGPLSGGFALII